MLLKAYLVEGSIIAALKSLKACTEIWDTPTHGWRACVEIEDRGSLTPVCWCEAPEVVNDTHAQH